MHTITAYARIAALGLALACNCATAADGLLWFEAGRPGDQAQQAVQLLGAAASHGLEPQDYNADALRQAVAAAAARSAPMEASRVMRVEQALTDAMQRYLGDLHNGRVDPRQIHHNFSPARREAFDARSALNVALAARRLPEAAAEAAPVLPLYGRLREVLARYRAMGDDAAWRQPLPRLPGGSASRVGKLDPGQAYAGLAPLAQRLLALGDLAPDAAPAMPWPRYEGVLIDAIRAFQQRHGLVVDGVVGSATMTQLEVTPAARVRQIELTLERLRWTPLMQGPRMIVVNIPEFVLRAYEVRDGRIAVIQEMKVIVGKALDTRTPLFDEDMRFIEFSPYWNVPRSIARNEIVPRLRRDPGYFAREDFEFVAKDGRVQSALTLANLDAVLAGQLRIRQRPGPRNALGDIKFVFPNRDAIFLHHTPATALFASDRRDFSHGCIRVEEPVALANFVLRAMPDWPEERIRQAMGTGRSTTLRLAEPVPVLIAYGTVLVKDGSVHFFDDLYGMDGVLDRALRRRPPIARQLLE